MKGADPTMSRERVELILTQLDKLPTLSPVIARLLQVTASEHSSVQDVVRIIETDAALTAGILRMIRRAELGVSSKGMTVARAVSLLGFTRVRNAVLAQEVYRLFPVEGRDHAADEVRQALWRHALATACAAYGLAQHAGNDVPPENAFVAGLVHDIGKLALDACLPKGYARVVALVKRERTSFCDAERGILGLDHTLAGKRLSVRWRFPEAITSCIRLHHQDPASLPSSVRHQGQVSIVYAANLLAHQAGIGLGECDPRESIRSLAARMDMCEEAIHAVVSSLPDEMQPYLEAVGLENAQASGELRESMAEANRKLAELNDRLARRNRELSIQAKFLTAIGTTLSRLSVSGTVPEVLAAAAESIFDLLEAKHALAYWIPQGGELAHAALKTSRDQPPGIDLTDVAGWMDGGVSRHPGEDPRAGADSVLRPVSEFELRLWMSRADRAVEAPLWSLRLSCDADEAGVIFSSDESAVQAFRDVPDALRVLADAVGRLLGAAREQAGIERANDELLNLHRQLSAAKAQWVQARTLSMITEMAAGAAHELNNPLAVIAGRAQLAESLTEDEKVRENLRTIASQAHRASRIVLELMSFAKPNDPHPLTRTVPDVLEPLCQHWREACSLRREQIVLNVSDPRATIHADPMQVDEALSALLRNAMAACPKERMLIQVNSPSHASDETVRIEICDNGVGMSPDVLERAFDPFYSNRPAGRGRGLGLSMAWRLIDINGGRLRLDSAPGTGTRATIELPAGRTSD